MENESNEMMSFAAQKRQDLEPSRIIGFQICVNELR